MARRFGLVAVIAALGAVAFWASRPGEDPVEAGQLVVHVRVVDEKGEPARGAQVRARFSQEPWTNVDGSGNHTLRGVPLNAGMSPGAASLGAAIAVRARFLAVRSEPEVRQDGERWHATFTLVPHGVLRLSIAETHLAPVKAWIEPDPASRFEAMGGRNVARQDRPAVFRVLPGLKELVVRVQGEADPGGVIRACNQRLVFEAPTPGVIQQAVVRAEAAQPISGAVHLAKPDGDSAVFALGGAQVVVRMLEDDKPAHELGRVAADKGFFLIPFTGRGPYALTLHAPLHAPGPMRVAGGGTQTMVFIGRALPWVQLDHRELDPKRQQLTLRLAREEGGAVLVAGPLQRLRSSSRLAFEEAPGRVRVRAFVSGTREHPPLQGDQVIEVKAPGEKVRLELVDAPFGTVAFEPPASEDALGSVELGARKTTMMGLSRKPATLKHVRAGEPLSLVVRWKAKDRAAHFATIQVREREKTTVQVPRILGGFVTWETGGATPTLRWKPGDTPYGVAGSMSFQRDEDRWRSTHALEPGPYRATIDGVSVAFTIRAGETVPSTPQD